MDDASLLATMTPEQADRAVVVSGLVALATADQARMCWVISKFAARAVFNDEVYELLAEAAVQPVPGVD